MPSIRNFLSRLSKPLANEFLRRHDIELAPDVLAASDKQVADAVEAALDELRPGARGALTNEIEIVGKLATETGEVAIDSVTLHDNLAEMRSREARALWLFQNDPDGFRRAEEIVYNDEHRHGRLWTSFGGEKGHDLSRTPEALDAFKEALRRLFDSPNIHVEIFDRTRPSFSNTDREENPDESGNTSLVQLTIYREGRPNAEAAFVDGELTTETRRRVMEAAITYEAATGAIECVAERRDSREEIVKQFSVTLLGSSTDLEPAALRTYDLTALQSRLEFATDPEDQIEDVSVSMLRLKPMNTSSERITVERWPKADRDIWSIIEDRLGGNALTSDYMITQARIVIRYKSTESNRLRSLPILITHPHKSSIKDQREIERLVASKYLPRWGIASPA